MGKYLLICTSFACSLNLLLGQDTIFTSSNLPIVIIDTQGEEISNDVKITARMAIIDNSPGVRNFLSDNPNGYDGYIGIEIRGSSSRMFPKKQYAMETRNEDGSNRNVSLLGLPAENDWILYAPYSDKSLIRNILANQLWEQMGHYASRCRLCELVLNDDYWGVYVLMEKIKQDVNRVDIAEIEPSATGGDELTGGYMIKIDKHDGEQTGGWVSPIPPFPDSPATIKYQYHEPQPDDITPAQQTYIREYIEAFEACMLGAAYDDPVEGYPAWLDVASFVDYFIVSEVGKNIDSYRLSAFMYKDRDSQGGQLTMGPIWDFNLAFGNANYYNGAPSDSWILVYLTEDPYFLYNDWFQVPFWWRKLFADPAFTYRVALRWLDLRNNLLSTTQVLATVDSLVNLLDEAQSRNFSRWPILDEYVWPNAYVGESYAAEVDTLKKWITSRLAWIDTQIPGPFPPGYDPAESGSEYITMLSNYPNPFNRATSIRFILAEPAHMTMIVHDLLGHEISQLIDGHLEAGYYRVVWNGFNSLGQEMPTGIYLAYLYILPQPGVSPEYTKSIRMTLLK